MSLTNVLILCSGLECGIVTNINRWLRTQLANGTAGLIDVSDCAGGDNAFQVSLWLAAIKHLNIKEFLIQFALSPCQWGTSHQILLLRDGYDETFKDWTLTADAIGALVARIRHPDFHDPTELMPYAENLATQLDSLSVDPPYGSSSELLKTLETRSTQAESDIEKS